MLDFYLILEGKPNPTYPENENLEFVAGISLPMFERLQKKQLISSAYSYFSDFRWDIKTIKQIRAAIENANNQRDTDAAYLKKILNKALETRNDLMAYGD